MVLGAENAYERLSEIMEWYQDVTDAYTQAQTSGATSSATEFYRAYYYDIANCSSSSYDVYNETYNAKHISLQGQVNGKDSAGALGLDSEFLENSILSAAIPFTFFGLSVDADGALCVSPDLPEGSEYMKLENLAYRYMKYDLCVGDDFVRVSDVDYLQITNYQEDLTLRITFQKRDSAYRVYVNGQMTESGVTEIGDTVVVEVSFTGADLFVKIG